MTGRQPASPGRHDVAEIAAAASRNTPVVLAIGACEQHGPHLPVSTDSILPVAVADRASATVPLVVAPPVTYGACSRPLIGGGESFPAPCRCGRDPDGVPEGRAVRLASQASGRSWC